MQKELSENMNSLKESVVSAHQIHKSYGDVHALRGVSLEVERGEIFGIIGPDGAGKTTLLRILTTLLLADSGDAQVEGHDVVVDYKAIRNLIGYMPGRFSLYPDLTIEENLNLFATVFNTTLEQNYNLIRDIYVHIEPFKKRRASQLSGGMRQKLALCCALIHKPSVLFLDEPSTGVDPVSRKELWDMLRSLKSQNITIVVSTPYMDEATLCDRIALIQHGEFMQIDTPQSIIDQFQERLWSVRSEHMYGLLLDLRKNPQVKTSFTFGDSHHITVDGELQPSQLEQYLRHMGHKGVKVVQIAPSIEDCYMLLSQKNETKNGE